MGSRIQSKTREVDHKRKKIPAAPQFSIPKLPASVIPERDKSAYDSMAYCSPDPLYYTVTGPAVPYEKKFALEKHYEVLWSGISIPQYSTDFTEAAYLERFSNHGLELYSNVLTLRSIAMKGDGSSHAMAAFFNTMSALIFSEQVSPGQVKELLRDFDKTEKNRKSTEDHNPAAWTALNKSFKKLNIPIAFHIRQMEGVDGIDAVCMKRYIPK